MKSKERQIHIVLWIAIFSAVLRLSPESPVTLFRLLLPYNFYLIWKVSPQIFKNLIRICLLFLGIAILQDFITRYLLYPDIKTFSYTHLFGFCIHYFTIFVVVSLIYCLWHINKFDFFKKISDFASRTIKFCLVLFVPYYLSGFDPMAFPLFGNINDFGCVLSGGLLVILFDNKVKRFSKCLYALFILFLLLYIDSKLCLFGTILEVGLYCVHKYSEVITANLKKTSIVLMLVLGIAGIYCFISSSATINGYDIQMITVLPLQYIMNGEFFPESSQSFTYRANCIIGIINILKDSFGIGVGPGNTQYILKYMIPDPDNRITEDYLSAHIWWFELMADIGWLIIIPMIKIYIKQFKGYCMIIRDREVLFSQIFVISFPLWCLNSSGLYTGFYVIMLITVSYILYDNKKFSHVKMSNVLMVKN